MSEPNNDSRTSEPSPTHPFPGPDHPSTTPFPRSGRDTQSGPDEPGAEAPEPALGSTRDLGPWNVADFPPTQEGAPPLANPPPPPPGSFDLPGYDLEHVLGRGAMGVVYRARQKSPPRAVAVKMILAGVSTPGRHERQRFSDEAATIARLNHPNIVQIYQFGEEKETPYFSMELVEGSTLAEDVKRRKFLNQPWTFEEAARLIEILALAVDYAHQKNVIHRDLKPGNVMLTADGTPKITDFGLAKHTDAQQTVVEGKTVLAASIAGTPSYMAPEQALGEQVSPATDVYALGAILYELITGQPPFIGETATDILKRVVQEDPQRPRKLRPGLPRDLQTICLKCLARNPHDRYESARTLAEDVRCYLDRRPLRHAPPESLWDRCRRGLQQPLVRKGVWTGLALLVVVLAALALGKFFRPTPEGPTGPEGLPDPGQLVRQADAALDRGDVLQALTLLGRAEETAEQARQRQPDDPDIRLELAKIQLQKGHLLFLRGKDLDWAEQECEKARAGLADLHRRLPDRQDVRLQLAEAYHLLGMLANRKKEWERSLENYRKAAALRQGAAGKSKGYALRRDLARTYGYMGDTQLMMDRVREAQESYEIALGIRSTLAKKFPENLDAQYQLARGIGNMGRWNLWQGKYAEAHQEYAKTLEHLEALKGKAPPHEFRTDLPWAQIDVAKALLRLNRSPGEEPRRLLREARQRLDSLLQQDPGDTRVKRLQARAFLNLGKDALLRGEPDEAREHLNEANRLYNEIARIDRAQTEPVQQAIVLGLLAQVAGPDQADPLLEKALYLVQRGVEEGYRDRHELQDEEGFRLLRDRPEFQRALENLQPRKEQ
jgi:tetratricopeptide (TPR) repeat protein/tRNA A-37 threonylcarbamoyl transferase component Bud32